MTPTLREHDIGIMSVGVVVDEGMIIPPHFESLTYRGQCKSDCLHQVKRKILVENSTRTKSIEIKRKISSMELS